MEELTVRRNRSFVPARYEAAERTEKSAGSAPSQKTAPAPGCTVSETLRQLMTRSSQAEGRYRESRRTLQLGGAVLAEVQDKLGRMAELIGTSAGGGAPDREALQAELEALRGEIDRIMDQAGELFSGEEAGLEALLDAEAPAGIQALPRWLLAGISQGQLSPEQLLANLGLDKAVSPAQLLAAVTSGALEENSTAAYLASLYLGAVIAGGASGTPDVSGAVDGLRQLLEKVAGGASPDQAIAELTGGAFTSLADFQSQFAGGTAPGLQSFLTDLLLSDDALLLTLGGGLLSLAGGGMELDLLMNLLTAASQSGAASPGASTGALPETAPAALGETAPLEQAEGGATVLRLGSAEVIGRDLSGVSLRASTGELVIGGSGDVTIRGTGQGEQAILVTGSGTVKLQEVRVSALTVDAAGARLVSAGESVLGELRLGRGASLTLDGGGLLTVGHIQADGSNSLRLAGGAVVLAGQDGRTPGVLPLPVVLEGPASLAAQGTVVNAEGKALEPFDLIWKALLPGWSSVTAMALHGQQARLTLLGGAYPTLARLWLEKGDPSHGYPIHSLLIQGRDQAGRSRTRYTYLHWSRQAGAFEELSLYPNPFTVTGGEQSRDWLYEEASHTLYILSNQVTAISGGAGTDSSQAPFSGRIALADHVGTLELTLGGVVCRVSSGRAFGLGQGNEVTLLLQSGSSNFFASGAGCAGISLGEGTSLCIDCEDTRSSRSPAGALTASGGAGGAGIGRDSGGSRDQTSRILIRGGVVTASGAGGGAGIGAGQRSPMGAVTILGGTVTAAGGEGGGAGIGAALGAPVGDISIRGGAVSATAVCHAAAIGAGVQGESGDILITGTARIVKALGGNPGADIGACLFGGCGKVLISGGADIGGAKLWTRSGVSLQMGEDTVTLPRFRLSSRALGLERLCVSTRERAQVSRRTIEADLHWVGRIQEAYSALYSRLEESFDSPAPVRDAGDAGALLRDVGRAIPLSGSQAIRTHSRRGSGDVWQLLW